jgi:hypothetical protein
MAGAAKTLPETAARVRKLRRTKVMKKAPVVLQISGCTNHEYAIQSVRA